MAPGREAQRTLQGERPHGATIDGHPGASRLAPDVEKAKLPLNLAEGLLQASLVLVNPGDPFGL